MTGNRGTLNKALEQVATDIVVRKALEDKIAERTATDGKPFASKRGAEKENNYTDDVNSSSNPQWENDEDVDLTNLRERRWQNLKNALNKRERYVEAGGGSYVELDEQDFFKFVTKHDRVVCHFYHPEFPKCAIFDLHLPRISRNHVETRFFKVNAVKAPFLTAKLGLRVLPTVIFFRNGVAIHRLVGFSGLGNSDTFQTSELLTVLFRHKMLMKGPLSVEENTDSANDDGED